MYVLVCWYFQLSWGILSKDILVYPTSKPILFESAKCSKKFKLQSKSAKCSRNSSLKVLCTIAHHTSSAPRLICSYCRGASPDDSCKALAQEVDQRSSLVHYSSWGLLSVKLHSDLLPSWPGAQFDSKVDSECKPTCWSSSYSEKNRRGLNSRALGLESWTK